MHEHRSKTPARPDLLPWQAAVMVACVTVAGLLHEHPGALRPLVPGHQTAQLRSVGMRAADTLNAVLWLVR